MRDSTIRNRLLPAAAAVLALLFAAGCGAGWAFRKGQDARDRGDWDLAVAHYMRATQKDPDNVKFQIALVNAKVQASRLHYDEARKHLSANDFERAIQELEIASNYDPSNRSAADDLVIARQKLRRQEDEKREREEFEARQARAQAPVKLPVPFLSPRKPDPISLSFRDASLQKVFETLGKVADVNVIFDEGFRDKKVEVNLKGLNFEQALDRLTMVNRLFYKVLDQNTLIIVPESRQKRVAYDELVLKTFYLQNAEVADTANMIKTLAKVTTVMPNASLNSITLVGTLEQVAIAERIIGSNDKARGEVVVEVKVLEVNRNRTKDWGLRLSSYGAGATLAPFSDPGEEPVPLNVRAHLLSSFNMADWVITMPSNIFAQFLANDATVRILAAPRLRAAEGKPAELKVGEEVPIPQTSFSMGVPGSYTPATSFTYKTVGVELKLTPAVSASGDIKLEMDAQFSLLGGESNVGSAAAPMFVPTFLTRAVKGVLRLRDGETGMVGGLLSSRETASFAGTMGMDQVPLLGKLLGTRSKGQEETEVVISITPRIVRGPKVTEDDMLPLSVGTEEVKRVPGARPGLFGPEPEVMEPDRPAAAVQPSAPAPARTGTAPAAPDPAALPDVAGSPPEAPPRTGPPPSAAPMPATPPPAGQTRASVMLSPPEMALRVGQSATLAALLVGARDVEWVELVLVADPARVQIAEATAGALITLDGAPLQAEREVQAGRARVRFVRQAAVSGSGAVAAFSLRGVAAGTGTVALEAVSIGLVGGAVEPVDVPAPARVVVSP